MNATNKINYTALIVACKTGHIDAIHVLLKAGSDTNVADSNGNTCLMYAVNSNCGEEVLQAIIDHGADVNATETYNRTALMSACETGHIEAIHVLLKAGSDTNIATVDGVTCLMCAVDKLCSNKVLQAIIDHGADVNATNKNNFSALTVACKKGHIDAIHVLLKAGSDTNIAVVNGQTCLMHAVDRHCGEEVLQAIIDHGADVNATETYNRTALMSACETGHIEAIHVLLKAGSDTNIAVVKGQTCLMCAVDSNCNEEVLQAIIDHGADVNSATKKYLTTALMRACQIGHTDAIHVLLKAGSDTNIVDMNGLTCLMCAVNEHCNKDTSLCVAGNY